MRRRLFLCCVAAGIGVYGLVDVPAQVVTQTTSGAGTPEVCPGTCRRMSNEALRVPWPPLKTDNGSASVMIGGKEGA